MDKAATKTPEHDARLSVQNTEACPPAYWPLIQHLHQLGADSVYPVIDPCAEC